MGAGIQDILVSCVGLFEKALQRDKLIRSIRTSREGLYKLQIEHIQPAVVSVLGKGVLFGKLPVIETGKIQLAG